MMHSFKGEPIDILVNGFMNLSQGLRQIAQNPALPEMVRNEFNALGETCQHVIAPIHAMQITELMAANGPRCQGLRDAVEWLKLPEGTLNPQALIPKVSFDWVQAPEVDITDVAMKAWSQFFYQDYPNEVFGDEGVIKAELTVGGYEYKIEAKADFITAELGVESTRAYIREVSVFYQPVEGYWTGSITVARSSAIFRDKPASSIHFMHLVEGAAFSAELADVVPFMVDYVINPLKQKLGFVFKDYSLAGDAGYKDDLKQMVDDIAEEYPEHHKNHVRNIITRACSNMGCAKGLTFDVPDVGTVRIVTGHQDMHDYDKWVKKREEHSWYRDAPLLKVETIKVAGYDIVSRRIPTAWNHRITVGIEAAFRKICAEYTHWPKSPEQLAAEKALKEQQ